jgi:REP-associated tyrosine transposase
MNNPSLGDSMPRANRYLLPGHVWHITHRCHKKDFLLKFAKDREAWVKWLFDAKKRFGLCVLNYIVTSNHVHLLVKDTGKGEIPKSMQLVAGRVAQEYNRRKNRKGAFWEDRYHSTAIAADEHLARCLTYIDLNMVRAGVVNDPADWPESGYAELMRTKQRYNIIKQDTLAALLGCPNPAEMRLMRRQWVEDGIRLNLREREPCWSESLAVGNEAFVNDVQDALGLKGRKRSITQKEQGFVLKEAETDYSISPPKTAV